MILFTYQNLCEIIYVSQSPSCMGLVITKESGIATRTRNSQNTSIPKHLNAMYCLLKCGKVQIKMNLENNADFESFLKNTEKIYKTSNKIDLNK